MKKLLAIVLTGVVGMAGQAWAQVPDASPATVQPATIAMLDAIATVAKNRTVTPAPTPLQFFQAPAPARPATAPAVPAPAAAPRPAPATAPPAAPTPLQGPAPPAPPPGPAPVRGLPGGPNIRFDVTITDIGGPKPVTKTLSLTIGSSNNNGSVRQTSQAPNPTPGPPMIPIPLNVDVRNVNWLENGIRATIAIEYQPYLPDAKAQPGMVVANATTVFVDGRRMQILATSDPVSDRRTTIEVTATVVK